MARIPATDTLRLFSGPGVWGRSPQKFPGGLEGGSPPRVGSGGAVAPPQRFVCDDGPGATTGRNERNERTNERTNGFSVATSTETALVRKDKNFSQNFSYDTPDSATQNSAKFEKLKVTF